MEIMQKMVDWGFELKCAIAAAQNAGKLLCDHFEKRPPTIRKSENEFVTKIDLESQSLIMEALGKDFPTYQFLAEETRYHKEISSLTWVIDPLDGTHNYISGIDNIGVSIALVSKHSFHIGVIYLPLKNLLLYAIEGQGAYCNDTKITVSNNTDLKKSMVAYDNQFYLDRNILKNYERLIASAFTTRIFGVATYDIALIAMGKIDARIWNCTKLVDIAAGNVIISEAGGKMTDFKNEPLSLMNVKQVIASNGLVHDDLIKLFCGQSIIHGNHKHKTHKGVKHV